MTPQRKTYLKRSTKPIARHKRLASSKRPIRARKADPKKRAFAKHRDPAYSAWIKDWPCLICQRHPVDPAHVVPRSRGSDDRANLVPLCRAHHSAQEGRTSEFEAKHHIDLKLIAVLLDQRYESGAHQEEPS